MLAHLKRMCNFDCLCFSRVRVWCLFLLSRLSARIVIGRGVCDPGCFQIRFRPGHRIVNGIRPRRHWNPFTGTLDRSKNRRSLLRSAGLTEVIFKTNFTSNNAVLQGYIALNVMMLQDSYRPTHCAGRDKWELSTKRQWVEISADNLLEEREFCPKHTQIYGVYEIMNTCKT